MREYQEGLVFFFFFHCRFYMIHRTCKTGHLKEKQINKKHVEPKQHVKVHK